MSFALLLSSFAAVAAAAPSKTAHAHVVIAGHAFSVEIVDTEAARERGLMFRTHMASDHGMLFMYEDAQPLTFWMKNTLIPLDILFFDAHRQLINVAANTPPCKIADCPTYASAAPAQYVLELNAQTVTELHIQQGEILEIDR
ncbi:MAG: DUF192 domain-containing protein [Gammaproteobacteria bacterium]